MVKMDWITWYITNVVVLFAVGGQHSNAFLFSGSPLKLSSPCTFGFSTIPIDSSGSSLDALHDSSSPNDEDSKNMSNKLSSSQSRREALSSALLLSFFSVPAAVLSIDNDNSNDYTPSKRATAYFVDSTIPPTIVPYRKQREAAILKSLGNGYGTLKKSTLIDETITLNNIMNKTISGAYDKFFTSKNTGQPYDSSFVFVGMDFASKDDVQLAIDLMGNIIQPRRRQISANTAVGLSWAPLSTQTSLNEFFQSSTYADDSSDMLKAALLEAKVPMDIVTSQLPLLKWARANNLPLVALAPQVSDVITVRQNGLQDLDVGRRATYVVDTQGFIDAVQSPKFKLYTEKSLMKDYNVGDVDANANTNDRPGDFFAERILYDEAVATAAAKWALLTNAQSRSNNNSLMIVLSAFERVRFLGGANERIVRVSQFLSPSTTLAEEAVTTILLNPTARKTLSQSNYLRTVIGTTPETRSFQTKIADYLWFSSMPKVNMLPRMMNIR